MVSPVLIIVFSYICCILQLYGFGDAKIHFSSKVVGEAEYTINEDLKSINQWKILFLT